MNISECLELSSYFRKIALFFLGTVLGCLICGDYYLVIYSMSFTVVFYLIGVFFRGWAKVSMDKVLKEFESKFKKELEEAIKKTQEEEKKKEE